VIPGDKGDFHFEITNSDSPKGGELHVGLN
jgi:hypothetical protein